MDYRKYYNELGKLLYAVANIDGRVQKKEMEEVHRVVRDELMHLEDSEDDFDMDAAFFTEFEFDYLSEENTMSSQELLDSFREYVSNTPELRPSMKRAAQRAAYRVANSFAGVNKAESKFLDKIDEVLRV